MNTTTTGQARKPNAYERAKASSHPPRAWLPQFTRDAFLGGSKSYELSRHLRLHVPYRTSRYHETIQSDSGRAEKFMELLGFAKAGPSWGPSMYARPGKAVPDVFTCGSDYLFWSTSELPGTLAVVPVNIEGSGCVELFVTDVVSLTLAVRFGGDEAAMLADHLAQV